MKFFKTFGFMLLTLSIIFIACNKDNSTGPEGFTSADMNRFVGNWAGHYEILGNTTADTLKISLGSGDADFSVIIHATTINPDTVNGDIKDKDTIDIPEQEMGGSKSTIFSFSDN